jgi:biopolymer transport protein ExbD
MASPAIKRQRKRRRIDTDGDPEFQVAPMVDVLLVLMLFFMAITSTEVLKKDPNLQLADANHAKKPENNQHKDEITVNVHWNGLTSSAQFSLDGVSYPMANDPNLLGALAALHKQNPASYVVIRADRDTQYSNVSDLMSTCASAGISTVSFSVLIGGGDKNKQPPAPDGSASN